jgi:hypothetical protein
MALACMAAQASGARAHERALGREVRLQDEGSPPVGRAAERLERQRAQQDARTILRWLASQGTGAYAEELLRLADRT